MTRAIWIVGLIALGAVILFLAITENEDEDEPAAPPPLPSPRPEEPELTVVAIQCPVCEGYGFVMQETRRGPKRRICRFCDGKGRRVIRIPPGNVTCPHCQGFGRVQTPERYIICGRCAGHGYIRQPFQPTE